MSDVTPTQADRDMAKSILWVSTLIDDEEAIVQAFARHRIASTPAPDAEPVTCSKGTPMTDRTHDDLKARLRATKMEVKRVRGKNVSATFPVNPDGPAALVRIEALEAALREVCDHGDLAAVRIARAALGDKHD